jgi:hypothetical protein
LPESFTDGGGLLFEDEVERSDLFNNVKIIGGQVADPAKIGDSGLATVLGQKPARTFPDPECSEEKETSGDKLYGEGDEPLCVVGRKCLLDAIVDPL